MPLLQCSVASQAPPWFGLSWQQQTKPCMVPPFISCLHFGVWHGSQSEKHKTSLIVDSLLLVHLCHVSWKGNYPIWGPSYPYMCQFHSENCPCIASWPELWTLALGKPSLNCTLLNLPPPTPSYLPLPLILCLLPFLSRGAVTLHAPYRLLGSKPCSAASVHISIVCSAVIGMYDLEICPSYWFDNADSRQ